LRSTIVQAAEDGQPPTGRAALGDEGADERAIEAALDMATAAITQTELLQPERVDEGNASRTHPLRECLSHESGP
jgi:hypothetical protein